MGIERLYRALYIMYSHIPYSEPASPGLQHACSEYARRRPTILFSERTNYGLCSKGLGFRAQGLHCSSLCVVCHGLLQGGLQFTTPKDLRVSLRVGLHVCCRGRWGLGLRFGLGHGCLNLTAVKKCQHFPPWRDREHVLNEFGQRRFVGGSFSM